HAAPPLCPRPRGGFVAPTAGAGALQSTAPAASSADGAASRARAARRRGPAPPPLSPLHSLVPGPTTDRCASARSARGGAPAPGIRMKLSIDHRYNFHRFRLLTQTLA